jgi:hypothetical protein
MTQQGRFLTLSRSIGQSVTQGAFLDGIRTLWEARDKQFLTLVDLFNELLARDRLEASSSAHSGEAGV